MENIKKHYHYAEVLKKGIFEENKNLDKSIFEDLDKNFHLFSGKQKKYIVNLLFSSCASCEVCTISRKYHNIESYEVVNNKQVKNEKFQGEIEIYCTNKAKYLSRIYDKYIEDFREGDMLEFPIICNAASKGKEEPKA